MTNIEPAIAFTQTHTFREMRLHRLGCLALLLVTIQIGCAQGQEGETGAPVAEEAGLLTIGSPAPPLNVEHWVQDGEGRFLPVTTFQPGNVYVVEFWATWCGPCVASMPHIAELQKKYLDQGVQIVSISDEDLATVNGFLNRMRPGQEAEPAEDETDPDDAETETAAEEDAYPPGSFGELTRGYCLATDPDGSSQEDYMRASSQGGIPTAFLVGKDGKIEWIGHPMAIDDPLEAVVAETWNREAFAVDFRARQEQQALQMKIFGMLRGQQFAEAIELLDEQIATSTSETAIAQFKQLRLQALMMDPNGEDKLVAAMQEMLAGISDDPAKVNGLCWSLYRTCRPGG